MPKKPATNAQRETTASAAPKADHSPSHFGREKKLEISLSLSLSLSQCECVCRPSRAAQGCVPKFSILKTASRNYRESVDIFPSHERLCTGRKSGPQPLTSRVSLTPTGRAPLSDREREATHARRTKLGAAPPSPPPALSPRAGDEGFTERSKPSSSPSRLGRPRKLGTASVLAFPGKLDDAQLATAPQRALFPSSEATTKKHHHSTVLQIPTLPWAPPDATQRRQALPVADPPSASEMGVSLSLSRRFWSSTLASKKCARQHGGSQKTCVCRSASSVTPRRRAPGRVPPARADSAARAQTSRGST